MPSRSSIGAFWDAAADVFDEAADHGLRDPRVRDAWATALAWWLPDAPADVVDLGCGTGSLAVLLAHLGHRVVGIDLSPNMINHARRKLTTAGPEAHFVVDALRRWVALSRPGGRLVLIEGRWSTTAADDYVAGSEQLPWAGGVTAQTLAKALHPLVTHVRIEPLTNPALWGRAVTDERYAIIATR